MKTEQVKKAAELINQRQELEYALLDDGRLVVARTGHFGLHSIRVNLNNEIRAAIQGKLFLLDQQIKDLGVQL